MLTSFVGSFSSPDLPCWMSLDHLATTFIFLFLWVPFSGKDFETEGGVNNNLNTTACHRIISIITANQEEICPLLPTIPLAHGSCLLSCVTKMGVGSEIAVGEGLLLVVFKVIYTKESAQ